MSSLNIQMFLNTPRDYEAGRFRIMNGLKEIRTDFTHNRIYPRLAELIDLYTTLRTITRRSSDLRDHLPKRIARLDLESRKVVYEPLDFDHTDLQAVEELIHWALPHLQRTIEEGQTIFNFVDDHLRVEEVGLLPSYVEEGYLLVPELKNGTIHVIKYEVSIFTGDEQRYRNLKTTAVKAIPFTSVSASPNSIKLDLITEHRDLPNPATYFFETDLDFPFAETILPVAKRKLLRRLYS